MTYLYTYNLIKLNLSANDLVTLKKKKKEARWVLIHYMWTSALWVCKTALYCLSGCHSTDWGTKPHWRLSLPTIHQQFFCHSCPWKSWQTTLSPSTKEKRKKLDVKCSKNCLRQWLKNIIFMYLNNITP